MVQLLNFFHEIKGKWTLRLFHCHNANRSRQWFGRPNTPTATSPISGMHGKQADWQAETENRCICFKCFSKPTCQWRHMLCYSSVVATATLNDGFVHYWQYCLCKSNTHTIIVITTANMHQCAVCLQAASDLGHIPQNTTMANVVKNCSTNGFSGL